MVAGPNDVRPATAADLGLRRDQIHDARLIRDAEANFIPANQGAN